jgi:hypothetical protein
MPAEAAAETLAGITAARRQLVQCVLCAGDALAPGVVKHRDPRGRGQRCRATTHRAHHFSERDRCGSQPVRCDIDHRQAGILRGCGGVGVDAYGGRVRQRQRAVRHAGREVGALAGLQGQRRSRQGKTARAGQHKTQLGFVVEMQLQRGCGFALPARQLEQLAAAGRVVVPLGCRRARRRHARQRDHLAACLLKGVRGHHVHGA